MKPNILYSGIFAMAIAFLTGCAVRPVDQWQEEYDNEGHGYPINWRHDQGSSTLTTIEYEPNELLVQKEIEQAKKESREPDVSHIPQGGRVTLHLRSHDPQAANPKNFNFVVTDKDGNVVKQETGPDKAPTPSNPPIGAQHWEATHTVDLEKPLTDQIKLKVVNNNENSKETYTIRHPSYKPPSSSPSPSGGRPDSRPPEEKTGK